MLAWGFLAVVFFQTMLGETLRLPSWVEAISPFWHLPGVPGRSLRPTAAVAELLLAAALVLAGLGLPPPRHRGGLGRGDGWPAHQAAVG